MNEYKNNNFNDNNNSNFENSYTQQNGYNQYQAQAGSVNEFTYNPNKKKSKGKKVLSGIIAVLCVAAIGTTSIVGYNLVTGKNAVGSSNKGTVVSKDDSSSNSAKSTVDRSNLPTIQQLSTPSDALTIPEIVKKVSPSVVGISCILSNGTATGSGIVMSDDGYIVTNAHVVDGAQSISVVLPDSYNDTSSKSDDSKSSSDSSSDDDEDNLTYTATLVGKDTQTDIAVLKIDAKGLTAAEFGTSADLQVGDASINSGNSGGPLINAYGQVIGITSAKVSSSVGEGLGFAIPIDEALPIVEDLMKNGYVTGRPSLGISGTDITSAYSSYYGIPQGFLVKSVTKGSGSEKAGIQENDIVIGINGTVISNISELNEIKNKCKVGDTVQLTIYRNKKMINVDVVLGESTEDTSEPNDNDQNNNNNNNNNNNDDYNDYYGNYGNGLGGYNYGYGF